MSKRVAWSLAAAAAIAVAIAAAVVVRDPQRHGENNAAATRSTPSSMGFSNYVNVRFAYSLCYPPQLLLPQGESADGDGQKFVSSDTQVTAIVYGSNNVLGQTLQQVLDQDSQGVSVNNKSIDANAFTFNGTQKTLTVIEKTFLQDQVFKTLNIQFPTTMAPTYASIAQRMIACFANTSPTQYSQ